MQLVCGDYLLIRVLELPPPLMADDGYLQRTAVKAMAGSEMIDGRHGRNRQQRQQERGCDRPADVRPRIYSTVGAAGYRQRIRGWANGRRSRCRRPDPVRSV